MTSGPNIASEFLRHFGDRHLWFSRAVVLAFGAASGASIVAFVWLTDVALHGFFALQARAWWVPLAWTPFCSGAIVWFTRRLAPAAGGSGIPQVMAEVGRGTERVGVALVSLRISLAKMVLTAWGLLAGLSIGREGPSVQIAAGVMHSARDWISSRTASSPRGLLVAGGAAGIAAAFNAPLAGVMFAIEELSRGAEERSNGLLVSAIVLAGLVAVSMYGDASYFGRIQVKEVGAGLVLPGLLVAVASGVAGGLFARVLIRSFSVNQRDVFSRIRQARPVLFAVFCGLLVAAIGVASGGATFGSGYAHTRAMLTVGEQESMTYFFLKAIATWLTAWSGVPAGIFAPSLAIGAALGNDISLLTGYGHAPTLIALGMAGFLAGATQAPLTAFIIVMEMVDGHEMVLSLMACAVIASSLSRVVSLPLYATLAKGYDSGVRDSGMAAPSPQSQG